MKRFFALLLLSPLGLFAAGAAAPGIVGRWDATAIDNRGAETRWTIVVKQDAGKLAADLHSAAGDVLSLQEVKFEAGQLTFQLRINPTELVKVALKLEGDRLDGRFEGQDSGAGTLKAVRVPDLTGVWTGEWEVSPDGRPGPHYMVLKQDGEKVKGTAGPGEYQQLEIANGKLAAGHLTFDIAIPNGPSLAFDFTVDGNAMSGVAMLKMSGSEKRLKLSCKRGAR